MQLSGKWFHHISWVSWKLWHQPWLDLADSSTYDTNNRNQFYIFWCRVTLYLWVSSNTFLLSIRKTNIPIFVAGIPWLFMMVVQVRHLLWESIVVIQFHPATYLPVMRFWFILKLTIIMAIIMDSKWNTIQQVSKTNQFKTTLYVIEIDSEFREHSCIKLIKIASWQLALPDFYSKWHL